MVRLFLYLRYFAVFQDISVSVVDSFRQFGLPRCFLQIIVNFSNFSNTICDYIVGFPALLIQMQFVVSS